MFPNFKPLKFFRVENAWEIYMQFQQDWRKYLQIFASVLLFLGSILFVWAFVYETYTLRMFSEVSRFALYATLGGTIFHLFGFRLKSKNE
jgi:hypothetical protein